MPGSDWRPGWLTLGIAGAAGFLLGVVVLVAARGIVHDDVHVRTVHRTRTVLVQPHVPNVVGLTVDDAQSKLRAAGYDSDVSGGGFFGANGDDHVSEQDPAAGAVVGGGATIHLQVN
jgi:beta-lactam-binding protein with PASTA domain